jgi:hypothetical protein
VHVDLALGAYQVPCVSWGNLSFRNLSEESNEIGPCLGQLTAGSYCYERETVSHFFSALPCRCCTLKRKTIIARRMHNDVLLVN